MAADKRALLAAPAANGTVAIFAAGLTRRFDSLLAVDRLDLRIRRGAFFGLLGSNGAGKSTTIKMLITLLPPTSGKALVAGFDILRQAREVRRHIGYVPQLVSADAGLTGRENLDLSASLYAIPRNERAPRIAEVLGFMGLAEVASRLVRTYSGGMIRRLEIAQAMLHHPPLLFLDEPTVGLDPRARHAVWERLRELRSRFGTSVLLTTHDMEEADALCDEVAIMHAGRLIVTGAPQALKAAAGPAATMDDVFVQHTGGLLEEGGTYREVARVRDTARRLE
ncbi:MAG TPA: ATP-binding cassette domain-containing protein [Myxococcales bacterium]|nr:ATP-binding cassette domain-containing protein [Myxococcales bacterium]